MSGCAAAAVTGAKFFPRVFRSHVRKRSRSILHAVVRCSLSFSEIEVEGGVGPNWVLASEKNAADHRTAVWQKLT